MWQKYLQKSLSSGLVQKGLFFAELEDIEITVERVVQGWERAKTKNDEYYLDEVALNLHGFYLIL